MKEIKYVFVTKVKNYADFIRLIKRRKIEHK